MGPLGPPVNNTNYEEEFQVAGTFESTTLEHPETKLETQFIKVDTLRQELERLPGPKDIAGAIGLHRISTRCGSQEETDRPGGTTTSVLGRLP